MQQHPELMMMIQRTQVEADHLQAARNPRQPSPGLLSTARALAGNSLIALGTRITPAPRPIVIRRPARPALVR